VTATRVVASLYQGSNVVRTFLNEPCKYETQARGYSHVKEDERFEGFTDEKNFGKYLRLGE